MQGAAAAVTHYYLFWHPDLAGRPLIYPMWCHIYSRCLGWTLEEGQNRAQSYAALHKVESNSERGSAIIDGLLTFILKDSQR